MNNTPQGAIVAPLIASAIAVAIGALVALLLRPRPATEHKPGRSARASAWAALMAGFLLVAPPLGWHDLRTSWALKYTLVALTVIATTGFAARLWPAPTSTERTAHLGPTAHDAQVDRSRRTLTWWSALLLATLAVASLLRFEVPGGHLMDGSPALVEGWRWALPMLVTTAIVLLGAWWAVRRIEGQHPADDPVDDAYNRARSTIRVYRATLFGLGLGAALTLIPLGGALNDISQGPRAGGNPPAPWDWWQNLGFVLIGIGILGVALALGAIVPPALARVRPPATVSAPLTAQASGADAAASGRSAS